MINEFDGYFQFLMQIRIRRAEISINNNALCEKIYER